MVKREEGEGEKEEEEEEEVGGCGRGWCRFAKRGLPLGCFARGVVERVHGRGMEVSLQSLRRVSSAPRCRPYSSASLCTATYVRYVRLAPLVTGVV